MGRTAAVKLFVVAFDGDGEESAANGGDFNVDGAGDDEQKTIMTQLLPYGSECWRECEESTVTPVTPTVNPILGGEDDPNDAYPAGPPYPLLWGYYEQTTADGISYTTWKWNPAAAVLRWA